MDKPTPPTNKLDLQHAVVGSEFRLWVMVTVDSLIELTFLSDIL